MQAIVVSSDQDEKDILTYIVRRAGLAVAASSDVSRVLAKWSDHPADLIVLALEESADPLQAVGQIRRETQTSLILLLDGLSEKLLCELLNQGADVVLQRPVSPQVLTAQLQALLRRSGGIPSFILPTLELQALTLDPSTRTVTVPNQEPRRLTQLEFRLLYVLMTHRGQVVPTEELVERVWGYSGEGNRDLVRGLVSRVRSKIGDSPDRPGLIETLSGVGYRFAGDEI